jgi:hypothetical protein
VTVDISKGDLGKCRSCGADVVFVFNPKSGKSPPYNPTEQVVHGKTYPVGASHFATCPQAPSWRGKAKS